MHSSASTRPAAKPPGTSMPASMTRAPPAACARRRAIPPRAPRSDRRAPTHARSSRGRSFNLLSSGMSCATAASSRSRPATAPSRRPSRPIASRCAVHRRRRWPTGSWRLLERVGARTRKGVAVAVQHRRANRLEADRAFLEQNVRTTLHPEVVVAVGMPVEHLRVEHWPRVVSHASPRDVASSASFLRENVSI